MAQPRQFVGKVRSSGTRHYVFKNDSSKDSLNLQLGVSLTAEKVAALTHDIVWMEEAEVNGQKVYPLTFKLSLVYQVKKGELSYKEAQERYRIQRAELAADVSFEI